MKILIDARLYGLENAGLGRYTMNLIEELSKIDPKNEYILLLRKKYFDDSIQANRERKFTDELNADMPSSKMKGNPDREIVGGRHKLDPPHNWKKVLADFRHYSFAEQIFLPKVIKEQNPDVIHFPHFNIPLLYNGKFVVTIHDMLMHKFAGLSATTLPAPLYFIKQLVYKLIFRKAVLASKKIIVPSNAVKKEVLDYYKIKSEKVEVIYE